MECERVREEFIDRLTGNLDSARSKAIDEHIAGCAACRAETERMRELWAELGALRAPTASGAAGRIARLIQARGTNAPLSQPSSSRRASLVGVTALALAASLALGVVLGRRSGSSDSPAPNAASPAPRERYVLLLHGPARTAPRSASEATADSVAEQAIVSEYRAWATRLRDSGALVMAEKLASDPLTMLTPTGSTELPHDTADELGGFFLIQADSAEAFRIARECPHLKHGGTVQVRRIQPT
jgi:hypothetical protein